MGNYPTGAVLLDNSDVLGYICSFVDDSHVYQLRQICKGFCETVDSHRGVSTLVFPTTLVRIKLLQNRNNNEGELPGYQEWPLGEPVASNYTGRNKSLPNRTLATPWNKLEESIPGVEPYRISAPEWLVRRASQGKIKRLMYVMDGYHSDRYRRIWKWPDRYKEFEVIYSPNYVILAEIFDEIQMQLMASRKQRMRLEKEYKDWRANRRKKKEKKCHCPENEGEENDMANRDLDIDYALRPLKDLMDCLALWMHPSVFPQLEVLEVDGWRSQIDGLQPVSDHFVWSAWMEFAPSILDSLLTLNKDASCGLKHLKLTGYYGKLVAEILFNILKIEMPALTCLEIGMLVDFTPKGDSPSLSQVTHVIAHPGFRNDVLQELGKLPKLAVLEFPKPESMLSAVIDEFVEDGLFAKLRKLYNREWLRHAADYPQSRHIPWDLPYRRFDFNHSAIPLPEDCCACYFPAIEYDTLVVLPRSTRQIKIRMRDDIDNGETIQKLRLKCDVELDEVFIEYGSLLTDERAWALLRALRDRAPREIKNARRITVLARIDPLLRKVSERIRLLERFSPCGL